MTINQTIERQTMLCKWINKHLKPMKRFNRTYGRSLFLVCYARNCLADVTHEEFKQAMARSGYFADCSNVDEHYSGVVYNVSGKSVRKLIGGSVDTGNC